MFRTRLIMPAVLGVVLAPLALGCSDRSPEAVPGLDEPVAAEDTCEALPSESVSSLFAVDVVLDEERSGPSSCAYLSKDGAHEVVVRLEEIPSAAAMDVAVSELASLTGGDPEEVDPGEADEVIVIGADDVPLGNVERGKSIFQTICAACHGFDGRLINWGTVEEPSYVGTEASRLPDEVLHKLRNSHPGAAMVNLRALPLSDAVDVLTYAATLPTR